MDQRGQAYLCDFGLSRLAEDNILTASSSGSGIGGTIRWLAPEILCGTETRVTRASDVYAYAMTCFVSTLASLNRILSLLPQEIISGQVPFASLRLPSKIITIVIDGDRPDRITQPAVSDELWNIITACWQASPGSRPTTSQLLRSVRDCILQSSNYAVGSITDVGDITPRGRQGLVSFGPLCPY